MAAMSPFEMAVHSSHLMLSHSSGYDKRCLTNVAGCFVDCNAGRTVTTVPSVFFNSRSYMINKSALELEACTFAWRHIIDTVYTFLLLFA